MDNYFCYENSKEMVRAISVKPLNNYFIKICFSNGKTKEYDVKPCFNMPVFKQLENEKLFSQVEIKHGAVFWNVGKGIDLCPSAIYWSDKIKNEQNGRD